MAAVKQPKAGVTWERIEDGIYRREGREGKPIYRAVRQLGGKDPVTRRYPQEVRTFNGSKVKNALKEARLWRAEGAVEADKGPRSKNAAASMTLQEALDALHQAESYAPWTLQLHGYLWDALSKADPRLLFVSSQRLWATRDGGKTWLRLAGYLTRHAPETSFVRASQPLASVSASASGFASERLRARANG